MNEENLKEMPEYVKNLPKPVQDLIFDNEWEKRTKEICVKYSLNEIQSESLIDAVLFVLIGLDEQETLLDLLENKLKLSNIKTEQIFTELEGRVFDYAYKKVTSNAEKGATSDKLPEIRPDILPEIERQIPQSFVVSKSSVPNYNYTPRPKVFVDEPIQTPVSVPRFKAVPLDEGESVGRDFIPTLAPKPNAGGIMDAKLNSITKAVSQTPTQTSEPKKYTSDPYREPIS